MRTSVSAKRCPECGKVTGLHASECNSCGHQFRTRFEEPPERTQAFDAVMLPRPPLTALPPPLPHRRQTRSPFVLAFLGSFCVVATAGLALWLAWIFTQGPPAGPAAAGSGASANAPVPSAYTASPRGRAEDLYERIGMAMSLYDVDQAAGGMGRLVRSSDPHLLLLSYDYPDQSVRISLSRSDLTGDDYRVQAVALYHGKTLKQHRTDDN